MKLIIDIDDDVREQILEIADLGNKVPLGINAHMIKAIANGTPISDNATNYDIAKIIWDSSVAIDLLNELNMGRSWWNSPYQKGGK